MILYGNGCFDDVCVSSHQWCRSYNHMKFRLALIISRYGEGVGNAILFGVDPREEPWTNDIVQQRVLWWRMRLSAVVAIVIWISGVRLSSYVTVRELATLRYLGWTDKRRPVFWSKEGNHSFRRMFKFSFERSLHIPSKRSTLVLNSDFVMQKFVLFFKLARLRDHILKPGFHEAWFPLHGKCHDHDTKTKRL